MKRSIFWMVMSAFSVFFGSLWLFYNIAHGNWTWAGLWFASVLLNAIVFGLHAADAHDKERNER